MQGSKARTKRLRSEDSGEKLGKLIKHEKNWRSLLPKNISIGRD